MPEPLLDRHHIEEAFSVLGDELAHRDVVGEIHVFGGAAMVLAFDARTATRDVDAVFVPDGPVLEAAWRVAERLNLPRSWLNNQASSYVSPHAGRGSTVFDHPNLRVMATPPEHLLAMKVRAARAVRDAGDIRFLLDHLGLTTVDGVLAVIARFFPDEPLSERSRLLLEDVIGQ